MNINTRAKQINPYFILTILLGTLLSILPHILSKIFYGNFFWAADRDEIELYLSTATKAFHNSEWALSDPVYLNAMPSIYPWIQLGPGMMLAKILGLGAGEIGFFWRLFAGLSISAGWFLLLHRALKFSAVISFVFATILLLDPGMVHGQLFYYLIRTLSQVFLHPEIAFDAPNLLGQWRIITPGLSLIFLLLYFHFLIKAVDEGRKANTFLTAAFLGALFYSYFYFWTFACIGLAGSFVIANRARLEIFKIGLMGFLMGIPALLSSGELKKTYGVEWLQRSDKFLPIPHTAELLIPKLTIIIIFICAIVLWRKKISYKVLLAHCAAGLFLLNHQLVTGLQMENFHWNYALGPTVSLLVLITLKELFEARAASLQKILPAFLVMISLFYICMGFYLRTKEFCCLRDAKDIRGAYNQFQLVKESLSSISSGQRRVIAGDTHMLRLTPVFLNYSPLDSYAVILSPGTSNSDLDERVALNNFLQGKNEQDFAKEQKEFFQKYYWGPEARNPKLKEERIERLVNNFKKIAASPKPFLEKFKVNTVINESSKGAAFLSNEGWKKTSIAPNWEIFTAP